MNCDDGVLLQAVAALLALVAPEYVTTLTDAAFFCSVREYLIQDMLIDTYRDAAASRLARALGMLSTAVVTIWVLYQGFTLISGVNRQPFSGLLLKTVKLVFVLSLVSLVAQHSPVIAETVLDFQRLVTTAVVGEDTNVYRMIDINLGLAQVINQVINNLTGGQQAGATGNSLTTVAGLLGQSGPAMITTVLALLAEIAITFAIMLAPLFIFFLLFQQTSSLFWSWSKFLLGTFVSLAALAVVSGIALRMSAIYGASVLAAYYANASEGIGSLVSFDITGSAMRMATLGTLLSAIVISVPPMIMQFFNAGVGFATGAMGGVMGGAMAGRLAGGGTGVPGMGLGVGGGSAPALGAQSGASGSYGSLPPPLPGAARGDSGDPSTGVGSHQVARSTGGRGAEGAEESAAQAAPGSRGLASPNTAHPRVGEIRDHQASSVEMRHTDDQQAIAAQAQDPRIGRGGHLSVSGAQTGVSGSASNNRASGDAQVAAGGSGAAATAPERYGGGVVPASAATPSHQAPPPGTNAGARAAGMGVAVARPDVPWGNGARA